MEEADALAAALKLKPLEKKRLLGPARAPMPAPSAGVTPAPERRPPAPPLRCACRLNFARPLAVLRSWTGLDWIPFFKVTKSEDAFKI